MAFSSNRSVRTRQMLGALRPRRPGAPGTPPYAAETPTPPTPIRPRSAMVAAAVYDEEGHRSASVTRLADAFRALRSTPGGMAWIGLERPDEHELAALAREFDLHPLAIEDAIQAHQRPKIERYGDTLFVVLHAARYLDSIEEVEFSELHLFVGPDFVVSVRHGDSPDLTAVRARLESTPQMLARGPEAVLYAIMDRVVDDYAPVVSGLDYDIDQIEGEVFSGDAHVSRRIYELSRELVDFQRAVRPLQSVCLSLAKGAEKYQVDEELQAYLRDVADHLTEVAESVETYRVALRDILTVNATLVAQRQNEEMTHLTEVSIQQGEEVKKISGWAAILFAPTLVGTVYGMNFDIMPELHWAWGYPVALVLMLGVSVSLFAVFRWKKWI
ncbi:MULTISPECIES: magnesium/cobalt transporter CorA [unclassified Isoptericola]|uniref:magnesium/cobalt transporter CorA n=1 Tax=unclassified Isoptericola TaxID=2623355 RepID=UPI0027144651|nr:MULTISPECIES: magnesium/cobalt transporter CorA [unclassified Isoptericola]MDO8144506.1 magnesium/cobalt transporter CorA [Isoptericola sp. 178]MDO8148359.1 magnesium/cobalt transporter CorA [Isoptericola sp. b515]MDO8151840.1 magnesium/cobalt transporter CorA [Isoptericola sp. b408]